MEHISDQEAINREATESATQGIETLNQAIDAMDGQPFSVEKIHDYTAEMRDRSVGAQFGIRLQLAGGSLDPAERYDQTSRPLDLVLSRDTAARVVANLLDQGGLLWEVLDRLQDRSPEYDVLAEVRQYAQQHPKRRTVK